MVSILKVWKELKDWEKALFIITTIFMFAYLPIIIFLPFYVGDLVMILTVIALFILTVLLYFSKIDKLSLSTVMMSAMFFIIALLQIIYITLYEPGRVTITPITSLTVDIITYIFLGISLISYLIISIRYIE